MQKFTIGLKWNTGDFVYMSSGTKRNKYYCHIAWKRLWFVHFGWFCPKHRCILQYV